MPELVAAHLILALYWTHQMDSSKTTRYIGLAHQSNDIIRDSPGALVASIKFVSVLLYDAKVGADRFGGSFDLSVFVAVLFSSVSVAYDVMAYFWKELK